MAREAHAAVRELLHRPRERRRAARARRRTSAARAAGRRGSRGCSAARRGGRAPARRRAGAELARSASAPSDPAAIAPPARSPRATNVRRSMRRAPGSSFSSVSVIGRGGGASAAYDTTCRQMRQFRIRYSFARAKTSLTLTRRGPLCCDASCATCDAFARGASGSARERRCGARSARCPPSLALWLGAGGAGAAAPAPAPGCTPSTLDALRADRGRHRLADAGRRGRLAADPDQHARRPGAGARERRGERVDAAARMPGQLEPYSQGDGASFVPAAPFDPGRDGDRERARRGALGHGAAALHVRGRDPGPGLEDAGAAPRARSRTARSHSSRAPTFARRSLTIERRSSVALPGRAPARAVRHERPGRPDAARSRRPARLLPPAAPTDGGHQPARPGARRRAGAHVVAGDGHHPRLRHRRRRGALDQLPDAGGRARRRRPCRRPARVPDHAGAARR